MTGEERDRRDSRALEPELIRDPQARAAAEARNGFRQYDAAIGAIQGALDRGAFKLRPSLILSLQREALAGISTHLSEHTSFLNSSRTCATTSTTIGKTARRFASLLT